MVPLLLVGLLSILGQVVLLRELVVAFYGVELVYILALGVWLISTAAGAAAARRSRLPSPGAIGALFLACALVLPLEVAFIRGSRILLGGVTGAYLSFGRQMVLMLIALVPIGMLLGLLFQRTALLYVHRGRTLALAYAVESVGGLAGGLVSTLALAWGVSNFALALGCAIVALGAATDGATRLATSRKAAIGVVAIVAAVVMTIAPALDRGMTRWSHPGLLAAVDSPYGRIVVARAGTQVSVFENDGLWFETEGTEAETLVHLAALAHPSPRRVLLLGGTIAGLVSEILGHLPERVDVVEVNRRVFDAVLPHLPPATHDALADPRVRVILDDPRRFLSRAGRYDLVIVSMPEPESGQANRFYTREFFEQVATHLRAGGVLAFRLRGAENYWTPAVLRRTTSIYRALSAAFPDVLVLPGSSNILIASNGPLERDPAVLAARLQARAIHPRLVTPAYISYLYSNDRFADVAARLAGSRAPANTDARPICYQYTAFIWLSKLFPTLSAVDPDFDHVPLSLAWQATVFAAFCLCLLAVRRFVTARRMALVALAGFIGMVLETVLLLHYQLKNGVVFQDIGILLTAVMAGLAGGAFALDRISHGRRPLSRAWGIAVAVLFAALGLGIEIVVTHRATIGLPTASALLAATGVLVSAALACASLRGVANQERVVAPLYAADLAGGAAGSLAATLLFIPLGGMALTAKGMAMLALALLLLV